MNLSKPYYYFPGMLAMVGMPLMLLIFQNFRMAKIQKVIEVNYPSSKYNKYIYNQNSEFDTIDFNHPKGNFYHFSFSENEFYHPYEKTKLFYLFKNKPQQFDGFHIDLKNIKKYNNYIFLYNQMMIHGYNTYFDFNDNFYCYYTSKYDSLYRKIRNIKPIKKEILMCNVEMFRCGYIPYKKQNTLKEEFWNFIQLHITYWYYWTLYFAIVYFSVRKWKSIN